ncbi:MAG: hypothetical protein HYU97_11685 [Deltaproteobacteria bacterium]|nr:hypothetical protein [Deltaproteobacteria bacterium]
MTLSDWISILAVGISGVGLYFSRASAKSSEISARASEHSAEITRSALDFEQSKHKESKQEERKRFIDGLIKEAVEKWKTFGNAENIINRYPDLVDEEKEEIRQRSRRGVGKPT